MSAAVELTRALVALDTVNPALVPGAPGERAAVELLAARLGERGFEIGIVGPGGRPSLLATRRGRGGGRSLALSGHLDTVGVEGMDDPFAARIEGGRMYGRGTCDMKAGVAAMVVAAERATGCDGDIILALVADEEHGSLGTAAVLEHLAGRLPDACIVGEPTWLDVIVAHRDSLLATVVRGGSAPFMLAAGASATIERRTVPGEPLDTGLREIEAILDALGITGDCRELIVRDAWELSDAPAAQRILELLPFAGRAGAPYWMESALWEAAGVPTVVCGPAGGGLHTAVEWVELEQLLAYEEALTALIPAFTR